MPGTVQRVLHESTWGSSGVIERSEAHVCTCSPGSGHHLGILGEGESGSVGWAVPCELWTPEPDSSSCIRKVGEEGKGPTFHSALSL